MSALSNFFGTLQAELRCTEQALAQKLGVNQTTLNSIINGSNVLRASTILRITRGLMKENPTLVERFTEAAISDAAVRYERITGYLVEIKTSKKNNEKPIYDKLVNLLKARQTSPESLIKLINLIKNLPDAKWDQLVGALDAVQTNCSKTNALVERKKTSAKGKKGKKG